MNIKAPPGYRFDPFADARMGMSLFQMTPEDWLVARDSGSVPAGEDRLRSEGEATQSGGNADCRIAQTPAGSTS